MGVGPDGNFIDDEVERYKPVLPGSPDSVPPPAVQQAGARRLPELPVAGSDDLQEIHSARSSARRLAPIPPLSRGPSSGRRGDILPRLA
jgi:hypothetical protein